MRWMYAIAGVALSVAASSAALAAFDGTGPGPGLTGNDTGGIIQWTPDIAHSYRDIAADYCARWHRLAKITSVHPWYGDYVGFRCVTDRRYDPRKEWYYSGW
jgi:hypothetical protein